MKRFYVNRPEVYIQLVEVEAESAEEAIQAVADGYGEEIVGRKGLDYSYTIDDLDRWDAFEIK